MLLVHLACFVGNPGPHYRGFLIILHFIVFISMHLFPSSSSDLVIGAYESQSVFVLRTIPVAVTNISITFNTEQVMLQNYDCIHQGNPMAWYDYIL